MADCGNYFHAQHPIIELIVGCLNVSEIRTQKAIGHLRALLDANRYRAKRAAIHLGRHDDKESSGRRLVMARQLFGFLRQRPRLSRAPNFVPIRNATRKNTDPNMLRGAVARPPNISMPLRTPARRGVLRRGPPDVRRRGLFAGDCLRGLFGRIDGRSAVMPSSEGPPSLDGKLFRRLQSGRPSAIHS